MDNRILLAYEEFNKNNKEGLASGIFGFAYAFKAGVEAEKKRVIDEFFEGEENGDI